jgi:superfamily II DNA or RNA helicase
MSTFRLSHLATFDIADKKVFKGLSSYDDFQTAIIEYGKSEGKVSSKEYNDALGGAFEVYTEFFFRRYGTSANPLLGVKCIEDTSRNKYQVGFDFTYEDFANQPAYLQSKFRSNPLYRFTRDDLGSFVSIADEMEIPASRRILFTNIEEPSREKGGLFHSSYSGGLRQMRVIARNVQEEFIDRDPTFWSDFYESIKLSLTSAVEVQTIYSSREHQIRMEVAQDRVFNLELPRGKIIAATGAGKTLVIFKGVRKGFLELGFRLQVVVAPTIDLIRQHHEYFEKFGLFHKDGISAIHFRTGEESKTDTFFEYQQTTKVSDLILDGRQLVFVTYASEQNLFEGFKQFGIEADCVFWDEFHHTVKQKVEYKEHLQSIPSKRNLFFSASERRGRVVSSFDEEVYGPTLINVTYKELRAKGILVPKIIIKPLVINVNHPKIQGLEKTFKKAAKDKKFDLLDGVMEAAGTIVARQNMLDTVGKCNMVTFSKAVAICKEIVSNFEIRNLFGTDLNTVHAAVPSKDRKKIYATVTNSDDSVLCQYSIVKEGIDINPFNSLVLSRTLDTIGVQQGIGRIARANPEDTKNFQAGLISLDDPTGWNKYEAVVYFIIATDEMEEFKDSVKDIIYKLQFAGFEEGDYDFAEILEKRTGVAKADDDWIAAKHNTLVYDIIQGVSVKDVIAQTHIEIEEETLLEESELQKLKIKEKIESTKTIQELIKIFDKKPILIFDSLNKTTINYLQL